MDAPPQRHQRRRYQPRLHQPRLHRPSRLSRITIYPIKSLDGREVESVGFGEAGWLDGDREFAVVDADGRFVNGKRHAEVHRVRAAWEAGGVLQLSFDNGPPERFTEMLGRAGPSAWLSDALGAPCSLVQRRPGGYPDDTEAPGPTLISTATLARLADWFPGLTLDEVRRRFRANLEFDFAEPFGEDGLVDADAPGQFHLGGSKWLATGVCQRCVVPSRDSQTGNATPVFAKTFSKRRQDELPPWSPRSRFDHFFRVAINTRLAAGESPGTLRVGDKLTRDD